MCTIVAYFLSSIFIILILNILLHLLSFQDIVMLCSKPKKRKMRREEAAYGDNEMLVQKQGSLELLSPLKSLKLSPILRCDENYGKMYQKLGILQGCTGPQGEDRQFYF